MTTRITAPRSLAQPGERIGGKPPSGFDGGDAGLRLLHPARSRCAHRRRQCTELRQRAGDIALASLDLDAIHNGSGIASRLFLRGVNANELPGIGLPLLQKATTLRRLTSSLAQRGN